MSNCSSVPLRLQPWLVFLWLGRSLVSLSSNSLLLCLLGCDNLGGLTCRLYWWGWQELQAYCIIFFICLQILMLFKKKKKKSESRRPVPISVVDLNTALISRHFKFIFEKNRRISYSLQKSLEKTVLGLHPNFSPNFGKRKSDCLKIP